MSHMWIRGNGIEHVGVLGEVDRGRGLGQGGLTDLLSIFFSSQNHLRLRATGDVANYCKHRRCPHIRDLQN